MSGVAVADADDNNDEARHLLPIYDVAEFGRDVQQLPSRRRFGRCADWADKWIGLEAGEPTIDE